MHLLYLDESGNPDDPADKHFILAGVAAFEQNTYFLTKGVDAIQQKHFPKTPPLDFHSQHIRAGKGFWRDVPKAKRDEVLTDIGNVLATSYASVRLFGAVIKKDATLHGEDAVKAATEQVCKRFDILLKRRTNDHNDPQRGVLVFAESHYQQRAKIWVKGFWELGTQWGLLDSICDIPYFAPAKESRLLQLADYVAHGLYLLYEKRDPLLMKGIIKKFHIEKGVIHGLVHVSDGKGAKCECPACVRRPAATARHARRGAVSHALLDTRLDSIPIAERLGRGFVQPVFSPPSRRRTSRHCPTAWRRVGKPKTLCVMRPQTGGTRSRRGWRTATRDSRGAVRRR